MTKKRIAEQELRLHLGQVISNFHIEVGCHCYPPNTNEVKKKRIFEDYKRRHNKALTKAISNQVVIIKKYVKGIVWVNKSFPD